jgi:hypothetical protein
MIYQTGLFAGKSNEQIALSDFTSRKTEFGSFDDYGNKLGQFTTSGYLHLKKILENRKKQGIDDFMTKNIEEIVYKLNNFIPAVNCRYNYSPITPDTPHNQLADYLEIEIISGQIPRGDHERYGPEGMSITPLCNEHRPITHSRQKTNNDSNKSIESYDIKFDILEKIPEWPKWVRQDVLKSLLECAGFSGKKTRQNCEDFFRNLKQR